MNAALVIHRPGQPPESRPLAPGRHLIGREAGDVVLRDPQCSTRHAELDWDGRRALIRDLGSTNGTFVGGARVTEHVLGPQDVITIGSCTLQVRLPLAPSGTLVATPAVAVGGTVPAMPAAAPPSPSAPTPSPAASSRSSTPAKPPAKKTGRLSVAAIVLLACGALAALLGMWVVAVVVMRGGAGGTMSSGEVTVNAVHFSGVPFKQVSGGTSPVTVRIAKNEKPGASVGVLEEFSGGTGDMWKTATWQAAFNASRAAGISLVDHEYIVRAGGHIDGPSAGMLLTTAMLALLRGDALDPTATMTGTVNPDGSAGPVGGIVQKMQGAKAAGLKRFGYPIGARNHVDLATGATVDLQQVAADLGLEAKEIDDIHTAYEFLTRIPLPRRKPVDESAMQIDLATSQQLRSKLTAWKSRVDRELAMTREILRKSRRGAAFEASIKSVNEALERAERFESSDMPVAAWHAYVPPIFELVGIRETIKILDALAVRDFAALQAQIDAARASGPRIRAFGDELRAAAAKTTVGGHVNTVQAMVAYVEAEALAALGDGGYERAVSIVNGVRNGRIKDDLQTMQAFFLNVFQPIFFYLAADVLLDLARDARDLAGDEGQGVPVDASALAREASGYGSAAGATLDYFEAIHVAEFAKQNGVDLDIARSQMNSREFTYPVARHLVTVAEHSPRGRAGDDLLRLAAGTDAFLKASALVNKYYALGAKSQGDGVVIENRKALASELDLARTAAREAAAHAQDKAGFIPLAARIAYQKASADRDGDDDDKVSALTSYWESALWSELAARLAQ